MTESASGRLRPDDVATFRMAQLLLMLSENTAQDLDLDRLSITEFLAANPFLIVGDDPAARTTLRLAGFGEHSLSYAAPGQRYATRRERIVNDVAHLVSFGLAIVTTSNGKRIVRVTERGLAVAARFTSVYADGYRASVRQVAPRLGRLSDKALQENLSGWLRADPMLFDLIDPDGSASLGRLYDNQDQAFGTWEQRDDE